jgi:hypothetical protein
MTQKTQKIISASAIGIVTVGGFEALIYILNLNQPVIYLNAALWIFLYLLFMIVFLYDLHIKRAGTWQRAKAGRAGSALGLESNIRVIPYFLWSRFEHFRKWKYFTQWLHFLLVPGFIFWSTISLLYINFGIYKVQQIIALLSSLALVYDYWYLKEAFARGKEIVDRDIFIVLTVVKIYAAGVLYAASLSMLRFYCLPAAYFSIEVLCYTFLLVYVSLYQHRLVNWHTVGITALIALAMAGIGYFVYIYWGYNYFTAAVFMTVCYNLFWGVFHYHLDRALTRRAFLEILVISLLIAAMVTSITNFRAKILDGCDYRSGQM